MRVRMAARLGAITAALALASALAATPAAMAAQWSRPSRVAGVNQLRAVSCVSRSFCMAVGGRKAVAFRYGVWGRAQTIDAHRGGLITVSCVSATFCAAGDGFGDVFIYDGARWSSPTSTSTGLSQLSCGARTFCGALGINGEAFFFDGSSWSRSERIALATEGLVISCPVAAFCMAVDFSTGYRLSRGRWVNAGSLNPSNPPGGSEPDVPSAVSCSGRRFCAALDNFGEAFTWAGSGWSRPHGFDRNLLDGSDAVSCRARTACVAVDDNGFATSWNGSTWSVKHRIDSGQAGLIDVSCGAARFCVAVDLRARAVIYR